VMEIDPSDVDYDKSIPSANAIIIGISEA